MRRNVHDNKGINVCSRLFDWVEMRDNVRDNGPKRVAFYSTN